MYAGAAAPSGWLLCDGSAVSRTTYSTLFAVVGTTYGVGDGSTTFNIPDLQGRFPMGKGTHANVNALGKNDGAAVADRQAKHKHSFAGQTFSNPGAGGYVASADGNTGRGGPTAQWAYGDQTSNMTDQVPFLTVNFLIKI